MSLENRLRRLWACRTVVVILLYVTGLAAFVALPLAAEKGGLDEKALLVGLMAPWTNDQMARYAVAAANVVEKDATMGTTTIAALVDLTERSLADLDHAANGPAHARREHQRMLSRWRSMRFKNGCEAVHQNVKSSRGDGTESLMLVMPIIASPNLVPGEREQNASSVASLIVSIGVQTAHLLSRVPWLSKDVIVLFIDARSHDPVQCLHTWMQSSSDIGVESHRQSFSSKTLDMPSSGSSKARGPRTMNDGLWMPATVQQGLIVDVQSLAPSEARLGILGYHGQMPNLDLTMMCKRNLDYFTKGLSFGMDVGGAPERSQDSTWITFVRRLEVLVRMTWYHAIGKATGLHAVLLQHDADALTLKFTSASDGTLDADPHRGLAPSSSGEPDSMKQGSVVRSARNVLTAIEMVLRTLNNLEERLHHATGLYFPASASHIVPSGLLLLPPGLLLLALIVLCVDALILLHATPDVDANVVKTGLRVALWVHGCILLVFVNWQRKLIDSSLSKPDLKDMLCVELAIGLKITAFVFVLYMSSSSWIDIMFSCNECSEEETVASKAQRNTVVGLQSFLAACIIILMMEAVVALLWRWSLSFLLQMIAIPPIMVLFRIASR